MEEIKKGLDEIYSVVREDIKITREGKEGCREKLKSDGINQRQRKVNLKIYDNIIGKRKYCGMKGA